MEIAAKYFSMPGFLDKIHREADPDLLRLLERKRVLA